MKRNRITLIVVLILLIIAVVLVWRNSSSTLGGWESEFAVQDTASVTKIFIADRNNNQVKLERMDDGTWMINDEYLAHNVKIESFLKTLADIRVRMPVPIKGRDNVIKRMAGISKKVEVYQDAPGIDLFGFIRLFRKERNTKTYYVGDATQDNLGTYMLMEGSDKPYIIYLPGLRGFVASRYSPLASEWRDHTIFKTKFKDIKSVSIEYPYEPYKSFKVVNDETDRSQTLYSLKDNQPAQAYDTARMLGFMTSFMDIRFESLLNDKLEPAFIDSVLSSKPSSIVTLITVDNDTNRVKTFYKEGFADLYDEDGLALEPFDLDRAYALLDNQKDFVLIQYFVFDKVQRTYQYLTRQEE
jgi:hypothetical protein